MISIMQVNLSRRLQIRAFRGQVGLQIAFPRHLQRRRDERGLLGALRLRRFGFSLIQIEDVIAKNRLEEKMILLARFEHLGVVLGLLNLFQLGRLECDLR